MLTVLIIIMSCHELRAQTKVAPFVTSYGQFTDHIIDGGLTKGKCVEAEDGGLLTTIDVGCDLPTAPAAGQFLTSQAAASTVYGAQPNIFYQQPTDTIATIEGDCSTPRTYVVTSPQTIALTGNHTMCSNVWLLMEGNGIYTINGSGFTLSNIQIAAGSTLSQHFVKGSASVALASAVGRYVYPQWFGAPCSGPTADSTAGIQAAIDSAGAGGVALIGQCAVDATGLFLYPANSGITLTAQTATTNFAGGGGGLIALSGAAPTVVLTVYAQQAHLSNLLIDCNSKAATNGLVTVFGLSSTWQNVTTRNCSGDGAVANTYDTPVVSITAGGGAGSSAVTVAALTSNRLTFGTQTCDIVMLDYGTTNQEAFAISSISGNTLNLSGTLVHAHTTARCAGNNNTLHVSHYSSFGNGGWGWHVMRADDNNAFYWADGNSDGNTLGGELWSGSVHVHIGGSYQADTGPAIQLGVAAGLNTSETTHSMAFTPTGDMEESSGNSVIFSVCDDSSQVLFTVASQLVLANSSTTCPTYVANNGPSTVGIGSGDGSGNLLIKTAFGTSSFGANSKMLQQGSTPGLTIYHPTNASGGATVATMEIDGNNGSNAEVPYAAMHATIQANTAGAQSGDLYASVAKSGAMVNELLISHFGYFLPLTTFTVATLPACSGAAGARSQVSDASSPVALSPVSGGGSVNVPVYCNGSSWIVQ